MGFRTFFSIILVLFHVYCTKTHTVVGGSTTTDNAQVSGSVYFTSGLPAKGAAVRIRAATYVRLPGPEPDSITRHDTVVDDSGRYTMDSLKIGDYRIEINDQKSAAVLLSCQISTIKDSVAFPGDTLRSYIEIAGKVDSSQLGKAPLFVQAYGVDRIAPVDSATGSYAISDLPAGIYTLRIVSLDTSVKPVVIDSIKADTGVISPVIGQWTQTNGPFGAQVLSIMATKGVVFAGTSYGGLYRSVNRGGAWEAVNNGLNVVDTQSTTGVTVRAIASSGTYLFAGVTGGGVFRSADQGATWAGCNNGLGVGTDILFIFRYGPVLFVQTNIGLFRSLDNGNSWTGANTRIGNAAPLFSITSLFTLPDGNYVFGSTGFSGTAGFVRSSDSGATWSAVNPPDFDSTVKQNFYLLTAFGDKLYAISQTSAFRASDNGDTWTPAAWGLTNVPIEVIAATPGATSIFTVTPQGLFRSRDTGVTWTPVNNGIAENTLFSFSVDSSTAGSPYLFAGTSSGIYSSADNGDSWTSITSGFKNIYIKKFGLATDGTTIFCGNDDHAFRSVDYGDHWVAPSNTIKGFGLDAFTADPRLNFLYIGNAHGVFRSSDNGLTWTAVNSGLLDTGITCLAWTKNGLFAGTDYNGTYRSVDDGASWSAVNTGFTSLMIKAIAVDSSETGTVRIFACTDLGIYQSTNNGASWSEVQTGLGPLPISCMGVYPRGSGQTIIYVGAQSSGVIVSIDKGKTWQLVGSKQLSTNIYAFAAAPDGKGGSVVFGASIYGVYQTLDNGATWSLVSAGLPRNDVFSLAVAQYGAGGKYLYAGTSSFGVWKLRLR